MSNKIINNYFNKILNDLYINKITLLYLIFKKNFK